MRAWHFVDRRLRDMRLVPPDGKWLVHEGALVIGKSGYHAGVQLIDALHNAPGNTICRVEVDGNIVFGNGIFFGNGILVAEKRKIIWRIDGDKVLRAYARWCALQVVHLWNVPDVVIKYLVTGDKEAWTLAADIVAESIKKFRHEDIPALHAIWWAVMPEPWSKGYEVACMADLYSESCFSEKSEFRKKREKQLKRMVYEARKGKEEWIFNDMMESVNSSKGGSL